MNTIKTSQLGLPGERPTTQVGILRRRLAIYRLNILNHNAPTVSEHNDLIRRAEIVQKQLELAEKVQAKKETQS